MVILKIFKEAWIKLYKNINLTVNYEVLNNDYSIIRGFLEHHISAPKKAVMWLTRTIRYNNFSW